jgi:hypothetical protein
MENFDYQDPGAVPEASLTGLGDSDLGGFISGLDGAMDNITAQDSALIAEYGHPADTANESGGVNSGSVSSESVSSGALGSEDQTVLGLLGQAEAGDFTPDAALDSWAGGLNDTVNASQAQVDTAIGNAENSAGYDSGTSADYNPATDALAGWNVADGIEASSYENHEASLASDGAGTAIGDADAAITASDD